MFCDKELHFRFIGTYKKTQLYWFPHCHVYQRNVAVVAIYVFLDWAKSFVDEKQEFWSEVQYMLLVMDSYGPHVVYKKIKYSKDNRIIVIGFPSQTSHIIQPFERSVLMSCKSYIAKLFFIKTLSEGYRFVLRFKCIITFFWVLT